jgi:hypothetical protein
VVVVRFVEGEVNVLLRGIKARMGRFWFREEVAVPAIIMKSKLRSGGLNLFSPKKQG